MFSTIPYSPKWNSTNSGFQLLSFQYQIFHQCTLYILLKRNGQKHKLIYQIIQTCFSLIHDWNLLYAFVLISLIPDNDTNCFSHFYPRTKINVNIVQPFTIKIDIVYGTVIPIAFQYTKHNYLNYIYIIYLCSS